MMRLAAPPDVGEPWQLEHVAIAASTSHGRPSAVTVGSVPSIVVVGPALVLELVIPMSPPV
jgi:hypothetical protein